MKCDTELFEPTMMFPTIKYYLDVPICNIITLILLKLTCVSHQQTLFTSTSQSINIARMLEFISF